MSRPTIDAATIRAVFTPHLLRFVRAVWESYRKGPDVERWADDGGAAGSERGV